LAKKKKVSKKKPAKKAKRGAPTKLTKPVEKIAMNLAKRGDTDVEISEIIGVSAKTIYNWKKGDNEFLRALKENKDAADDLVEAALYQRATGYTIPDGYEFVRDDDGVIVKDPKTGRPKRKLKTKHYAPDIQAQSFWLTNRRKGDWKNKQEHSVDPDTLTDFSLAYNLDGPDDEIPPLPGNKKLPGSSKH